VTSTKKKATRPKAESRKPSRAAAKTGPKSAPKAKAIEIPPALAPVVRALSGEAGVTVEKGWGSASVALKVRGKIFAMTIGKDLVLKLPKARVEELVGDGAGTRFDPRKDGRVMNEWAVVPPGGAAWLKLAREAHRFVAANA